jgi:hypothetical protein
VSPPRNGSAERTDVVSVTFDRALDTSSVNGSSFRVFGRNSGAASGTFSFSNSDMTVTLTPNAPFAAGEVVTVNLAGDAHRRRRDDAPHAGLRVAVRRQDGSASATFTEIDEFGNGSAPPPNNTRIYGAMASDLNNDGWTDLMTVNEVSADVRVFLSLADGSGLYGSFLSPQAIGQEASPNEPGDFDNDGNVDTAIGAAISDTVSIGLGAGNGMFSFTRSPSATRRTAWPCSTWTATATPTW